MEVEAPLGTEVDEECNNVFDPNNNNYGGLPRPGGTEITDGEFDGLDDNPYGPVSGSDEYIDVDYCTNEVI